ncbi:unnamed protein product, partial [Brenthis ino]
MFLNIQFVTAIQDCNLFIENRAWTSQGPILLKKREVTEGEDPAEGQEEKTERREEGNEGEDENSENGENRENSEDSEKFETKRNVMRKRVNVK